jgi:5-methylcytosine-specific restriction protein B
MLRNFTWIPIYEELARELTKWENRQNELISFLEELRTQGFVITPLSDKDGEGARSLLREIDPFTFFGVFNRRISFDQRLAILSQIKFYFQLQNELPEDEHMTWRNCGASFNWRWEIIRSRTRIFCRHSMRR